MYSTVICGNALEELRKLPNESINMCHTCPTPFRYHDDQAPNSLPHGFIGNEENIKQYIDNLTELFREVYRVLKKDGSLYVMMTDFHSENNGSLQCLPERFVISMIDNNEWILRNKLIWYRTDKIKKEDTTRFNHDHEFLYFFTKERNNYYFDGGSKYRQSSVLKYPYVKPTTGFASGLPHELVKIPILCSTKKGGIVLDPLAGTGTAGFIAKQLGRNSIMIELDPLQCRLMNKRFNF